MLGSFMEEMQITPEQFEFACLEGRHVASLGSAGAGGARAASAGTPGGSSDRTDQSGGNTFSFHQGLFQQIWAANDIRIFIRMMVQRNVELQLQALDLIERRSQSLSTKRDEGGSVDVGETGDTGLELKPAEDTPEEREIEQDILKSVENELKVPLLTEGDAGAPDQTQASALAGTLEGGLPGTESDKFQRLNLFFDQEKVCGKCFALFSFTPFLSFSL